MVHPIGNLDGWNPKKGALEDDFPDFNWVIFRWTMSIFRGVLFSDYFFLSLSLHTSGAWVFCVSRKKIHHFQSISNPFPTFPPKNIQHFFFHFFCWNVSRLSKEMFVNLFNSLSSHTLRNITMGNPRWWKPFFVATTLVHGVLVICSLWKLSLSC